jgi:hypothetical protein
MSKNTTRKGLALGAASSLVLAAFTAATPAYANETLSLAPSAGTAYKVLTTSDFKLAASYAGTESTAATYTLKYRVTNAGGATMTFDLVENGSSAPTIVDADYGDTSNAAASAADVVVYSSDDNPEIGAENSIIISVADSSTTDFSISVQAWLDIDGGNDIDANEARSPIRTIQFVDYTKATGSVALDTAVNGADNLSAVVTLDGFNYDQLDADDVAVRYLKDNVAMGSTDDTAVSDAGTGTSGTTAAARKNPNVAAWSAADAELRSTFYPEATDGANADTSYNKLVNVNTSVYTAQLYLWDGSAYAAVTSGASGSATPTSGKIASLSSPSEAVGAFVIDDSGSEKLRSGDGSLTVSTTATVTSGTLAGHTVTFKIAENGANTLDSAARVTSGGKTLSNSSAATIQSITVTAVTDADGIAKVTLSYTGLKASNALDISVTGLGASATITGAANTFTGQDSVATVVNDTVYGGKLGVVKGSSLSINYNVVDQFGQVPSGTFRLVISENSSDANFTANVNVTSGAAAFSTTENSASANAYTVTATAQKQATDGTWGAIGGGLTTTTLVEAYASAPVVATVEVSASDDGSTTALALELDDTYSGNKNLLRESVAFPTLADVTTLTYTVKSSSGAALIGVPISVSGAGLQFSADSATWFGVGSLSGSTDASGQFVVKVYSNLAGTQTVSATAGGVTKTQSLKFATAKDDTGAALAITAPANVAPGSTFKVTVKLTDKYGNPVVTSSTATGFNNGTTGPTLAITYTGPGLIVGTLPTTTGAGGTADFSVLLGTNDKGSISVSATYDKDDSSTTNATVTATASMTIGASAASADAKVNVGSFNGKLVVYAQNLDGKRISWKVGGNWGKATAVGNTLNRFDRPTPRKGVTVSVEIYVDGVKTLTKSVVTR